MLFIFNYDYIKFSIISIYNIIYEMELSGLYNVIYFLIMIKMSVDFLVKVNDIIDWKVLMYLFFLIK